METPSTYWSCRVSLGATGLREPIVHVEPVARVNPLLYAVEDNPTVLGPVETEVAKIVQHTGRLRHGLGVGPRDVAGQRIGRAGLVGRRVSQQGIERSRTAAKPMPLAVASFAT
jgi:hypothetical protein